MLRLRARRSYGFDSLSLISVAHKLRAALGVKVTTVDIFDYPTIAALSAKLGREEVVGVVPQEDGTAAAGGGEAEEGGPSGPAPEASIAASSGGRGGPLRVLFLHGFRTSADMMEMQARGLVKACEEAGVGGREVVFDFVDAPHVASGPAEPSLPAAFSTAGGGLREWWGRWAEAPDGGNTYLRGWTGPEHDGLDASLAFLEARLAAGSYDGVAGFSQGAAMAALLLARQQQRGGSNIGGGLRFALLFSGVSCAPLQALCDGEGGAIHVPCAHVYDPDEDFVSAAHELQACFDPAATDGGSLVLTHSFDHTLPVEAAWYERLVQFMASVA